MIKISSLYLFSNFLRVTQEFYDDKAKVKMKSLTLEREFDFSYREINEISYENQAMFGFGLLAFIGITLIVCSNIIYARPLLILVTRCLYVFSVMLFLIGFIKNRYYYFIDKNKKVLTFIKVTQRNYESIVNALELIGMKSGELRENGFDNPFPVAKPRFELIEYDIPNYFNKSKTRFYEDELIEVNNSIINDSVSYCRYDQLSGKIYRGKEGNSSWGSFFWIILTISIIVSDFYIVFNILPRVVFLPFMAVLTTLLVISLVLRYAKHQIVGFYDKNDRIAYWMWINRSNKEKIDEIIEFIQARISPLTNDELLKEQI